MTKQSIYHFLSTISTGLLFCVTALSGILLSSSRSFADSATASVTVGSACTMTATVNTAHTAEVPGGTTKTDIGSTTLNTICNDAGGYAIYAVGYTGDEYGNNKMSNGTVEFNTGTGTSASNWNMSLNQVTTGTYATTIDGGFGSYSAIPATYTKVAHRDSVTDPTTGSSINLTYGAYVASTQAPGDYVGKVKFTMVHPASEVPLQPVDCPSGYICYNPNGGNVIGTMGQPTISSSATSATLLASNFSRESYGFAGWSDAYDYATNPNAHFYGPQEDITFTAGQYTGSNNGLALYAVWVKSQGSIQDTSKVASICSSLTTAPTDDTANLTSVSALTDQRDNETYAIAKLADGKCWMIENLRLESTADHNSDGTLAQGYGISATYGNFGGLADAESASFSSSTTANSLYYSGTQSGAASINIGTSNLPGYRMPRYNNTNTTARASSPILNIDSAMYSYGNYYTWHAAIADLTYNGTNNQSTTSTSLCPNGWHLPKGGDKSNKTNNEFWSLVVTGINGGAKPANYDSNTAPYFTGAVEAGQVVNKLRSYPNNFLYSGYFGSSSAYSRGSSGYYWSSTARNNNYSHYLHLSSSDVYTGTKYNHKYYGHSIRCLTSS